MAPFVRYIADDWAGLQAFSSTAWQAQPAPAVLDPVGNVLVPAGTGLPLDISGWTAAGRMDPTCGPPAPKLLSGVITDGPNGEFDVFLLKAGNHYSGQAFDDPNPLLLLRPMLIDPQGRQFTIGIAPVFVY